MESVIKKFLLRRGTLRFPVQATEFCVEARGKPSYILAIVEVNLDAVIITFEGLERQERIEKCRIRFGKTLEKGSVVEDEVVKLETGSLFFEVVFQNRKLRYYCLSQGFIGYGRDVLVIPSIRLLQTTFLSE